MELTDLGKLPISEQAPAGRDVRYESDTEILSGEIEKRSSPTASGGADWHKIAQISEKILREQSKDLLVACYLSTALLEIEKLEGFSKGVHMTRDLLENFWETLFPPKKRMRGRINAIDWWLEKTMAALRFNKPDTLPAAEIDSIIADLKAIDDFLGQNMKDAPPLRGLMETIESLKMVPPADEPQTTAQESPQPETSAQEAPKPAPAPVPPKAVGPVGEIQSDEDFHRVLRSGLGTLREISTYYMDRNPFHPMVYRLNRISAWTMVEVLPPSTDNKTRIPPPPQHITHALTTQLRQAEWENLIKTAESRIGEFLFWLDLNRFVVESLEKLGHEDIGEWVTRETSHYVARMQGIEDLCFSDGMPFADDETKDWLKQISTDTVRSTTVGFTLSAEDAGDTIQGKVSEVAAKAQQLVKTKKLSDAVHLLHQPIRNASSGKEKLLWRLALVQLLINAKKERLALPHLHEILQDVEQYRLEQWDPDMSIQTLVVVYAGFSSQKDKEYNSKASDILDRIAGLNPVQAILIGG